MENEYNNTYKSPVLTPRQQRIYSRVISLQQKHTTFLDSTERNLTYFLYGKPNTVVNRRTTLPFVDLINNWNNNNPDPDNPFQHILNSFTDEISASEFSTKVRSTIKNQEPYSSYSDILEDYLSSIHRSSKRKFYLKPLALEVLLHGYFGLYYDINEKRWYPLSAYELFPGNRAILNKEDQPMWIRRTYITRKKMKAYGADPLKEQPLDRFDSAAKEIDEIETYLMYDVWIKEMDTHIGFSQSGQVLFDEPFPNPKKYPIFVGNTSELINSFYTVPKASILREKLKDYQNARKSIKDSSSSIAKPILVVDDDARIDINALTQALREGYKHVIVQKNSNGDVAFKAPGQLPSYAQMLPDQIEEDMMKVLGLNKAFLGISAAGTRERGALARLIKTSFRTLVTITSVIEDAFTEMDEYILEYIQAHEILTRMDTGLSVNEIFNGRNRYIPTERFTAYSTEDNYENKMLILNAWKSKLISTQDALEGMGYNNTQEMVERLRKEAIDTQVFSQEASGRIQQEASTSTYDKVVQRLNGKLMFQYYITPITNDKMLIKCDIMDIKLCGFLLADMDQNVLIEPSITGKATESQNDINVTNTPPALKNVGEQPTESPTGAPAAVNINQAQNNVPWPGGSQPQEETRGRKIENVESNANSAKYQIKSEAEKQIQQQPKQNIPESAQPTPVQTQQNASVQGEGMATSNQSIDSEIAQYIDGSRQITNSQKYENLPGLYIVEPHAKAIFAQKKTALVLGKDYTSMLNKPLLLLGDKVYGVIILKKVLSDFDFNATRKYHLVSDKEKSKWWGDKPTYLYLFEFYPFKYVLDYRKVAGQQTFVDKVNIITQ